jgi:hypothetical protein
MTGTSQAVATHGAPMVQKMNNASAGTAAIDGVEAASAAVMPAASQ